MKPVIAKTQQGWGETVNYLAAAFVFAAAAAPVDAATQYWVGGASGFWSDAVWADAAGGAGGTWVDGNSGYFTTSPSTIDLNGTSPTIGDFRTSGFSEANRCVVNITNTSDTPSTITFSNLNYSSDPELAYVDLTLSNVAVIDTSNYGFEINNNSRITFKNGSTYDKPAANKSGYLCVGLNTATSNELSVVSGATVAACSRLCIGSPKSGSNAAVIGVVRVADGGTLNAPSFVSGDTTTADGNSNYGYGMLVVDDGGIVNVTGDTQLGCSYKSSKTYKQTSIIKVNSGGTLNLAKLTVKEYGTKAITIDGGLLKTSANFEGEYASSGLYKSRNFTLTVENGGVLETGGNFWMNSYKSAKQTVVFDGGTFRAGKDGLATQDSGVGDGDYTDFTVGRGGLAIDTQGHTLTWQTKIDGGSGKVAKKGSGTLKLTGSAYNEGGFDVDDGVLSLGGTYTKIANGALTVKSGATLEKQPGNTAEAIAQSLVFADGAKFNVAYSNGGIGSIAAGAIDVQGSLDMTFGATPDSGIYELMTITGEGTFDESVLARIKLPADPVFAAAKLSLSDDAKSVVFSIGSDPVWIGGTSGDLGVASNWSNGAVPQAGTNAIIIADAAATLTSSAAFGAKTITFSAGCPKITIEGAPLEGIEAINNLSSANHEFIAAVSADALTISNTTTYCVFTGGLEANSVTFAETGLDKCSIYGVWHIKGDWTPVAGNSLYDGASVTVDGTLFNPNNLVIYEGCVVTAAALEATDNCGYLTYCNSGRLVVTGRCSVTSTVDCWLTRSGAGDSATVEFGSFYAYTPGKWMRFNGKDMIVGAGGIDCNSRIHFMGVTLHPKSDGFTIAATGANGSYSGSSAGVTINTTQYGTENTPATVTIDAAYVWQSNSNPGAMAVKGCGTVLFNSVSTFSNGLTVSSGATVAVNAGMRPGNGTVTVREGATLQVAQSGTVALNGGLTLDDGAALAFNFTDKKTAPVLDVSGKTVKFGENGTVSVKISAAEGGRPTGGKKTLTSGAKFAGAKVTLAADAPRWVNGVSIEDGEIVLDTKHIGLAILLR